MMKVNYVLMYGTPYLKYREFDTFENVSKFLVNKSIVNYSIFKKLEDKEEVEMIYRDNDIRYLENENKRLNNQYDLMENSLDEKQEIIEKAINKIQYIIDYGFDYDGFNTVESLKGLIDMLVDYARQSKDILQGSDKE